VNDQVIGDFKDFLKSQDIAFTDQDIAGVRDWINANIQSEIFTSQFGQQEGPEGPRQWDPMIQKALGYLPQAQTLEENAEKVVAR
jgi:carboxyl-terminal processing protease